MQKTLLLLMALCAVLTSYDTKAAPPAAQPANFVTVYGKVVKQGRYSFDPNAVPPLTVTGAIQNAGGFTGVAQTSKVKLIRKTQNGNETIVVNADKVLKQGDKGADLVLKHADVIIVDEILTGF